jgi:NADP-dependent 3-hydroxy acid dehydrogenase YdfG
MVSPLADRAALVTGAGSGIGAAVATALAAAGTRVCLLGRREEPLRAIAERIRSAGGDALVVPGDVRDYAALESAVESAEARFGRLDILVANAAVADSGPVAEADPEVYRAVIETNVIGVLNAIRASLPGMVERGAGHILVLASVSGRITYIGEPAYVASKHASIAFADSLRQEVAEQGIRVTIIEPGLVETPLIHVYPGALDMVPGVVPLDPTDVARAAMFALEQPPNVNVAEIVLRPTTQLL